jgi:MFS family permease
MALKGTSRVWIQTTAYSMVNRVVPLEKRGKMMGYYNATFYLSWGLGGTILTGPIADAIVVSNTIIIIIYVIIAFLILGSLLYFLIDKYVKFRTRRKSIFYSALSISIISVACLSAFTSKPIANLIINSGSTDSYAYKITFYVAAVLIAIGVIIYTFFRPPNFKLLSIDKSNKVK